MSVSCVYKYGLVPIDMTSGHATAASYEGRILTTKMRDPEGHRAMHAAGEAWKKIKTRGARLQKNGAAQLRQPRRSSC